MKIHNGIYSIYMTLPKRKTLRICLAIIIYFLCLDQVIKGKVTFCTEKYNAQGLKSSVYKALFIEKSYPDIIT